MELPIFVYIFDGTLDVCSSMKQTRVECELSAILSQDYLIFDGKGNKLKPIVDKEPKEKSFLGIDWMVEGKYSGLEIDVNDKLKLSDVINDVAKLHENSVFKDLKEVRKYILENDC